MFVEENAENVEVEETSDDVVVESEEDNDDETDADVIEKSLFEDDDDDDSDKDGEEDSESDDDGSEIVYEKTDIKEVLGEEAVFDDALWDAIVPKMKELNATQEQVDSIAKIYAEHVKNAAKNYSEMLGQKFNDIKEDWKKESLEEFKGNFKDTLKTSGLALKKFGTPELINLLTDTGVQNHKEMIAFCAKVGKYFQEDEFEDGDPVNEDKPEDVLYPSMNK